MARLKAEAGFTLVELLVAVAILGFVMAAVLGIYQVTQRSTLTATAGEDAQLVARAVLERLTTELRMINAGRSTNTGAIAAASVTSVTFLGDIDNDTLVAGSDPTLTAAATAGATTVQVSSATGFSVGELLSVVDGGVQETQSITGISGTTLTLGAGLSTSYSLGSVVRSVETVTYTYTADATGGTLTRTVGASAPEILADSIPALTFTYWDGSIPPVQITDLSTQANRDQIREVRIQITVRSQSGDLVVSRTMAVTVRPRNFF